jgi:hypothetical protein
MSLILVVGVAIYVAIISGVVQAAGPAGSPGFVAVLTAEAVFTLVSGTLLIRHFWRAGVRGQLTNAKPGRRRGAGAAGLGLLAASAGPLGAFLIVASALLSAGFVLAATVTSLFPVTPAERSVRRQLAEALQQNRQGHSEHPVATRRSKHHGSH